MTRSPGRRSRFQVWGVPLAGVVAGAGFAVLTAQSFDRQRAAWRASGRRRGRLTPRTVNDV